MDAVTQILREKAINILLQPILDINTNTTFAYEALARGPIGTSLYYPTALFSVAQKLWKTDEVDVLCLEKSLLEGRSFPDILFINIRPETLIKKHDKILKLMSNTQNVVLEIAEVGLGTKLQNELAKIVRELKGLGIRIALDDIGAGDRNFTNICEIPADFLKIDRCIIQGLTKFKNGSAPHYLALLKALHGVSKELGAAVIAEGVENPLQLQIVSDAGIKLVQGFLISHPKPVSYWINDRGNICAGGSRYL